MSFVPDALRQAWIHQLGQWSCNGAISKAAQEALKLPGGSAALQELVGQWAAGDFSGLPPVEALPANAMTGARGAYASSTGTIYLNDDWLRSAPQHEALAVLTEELGHYLDGVLNGTDTAGDEGELFALLLQGDGAITVQERERLLAEDDCGLVDLGVQKLVVERAATVISTPIPAASPGRTRYEVSNAAAFAALRSDGSVVTWGYPDTGGESTGVDFDGPNNNLSVTQVFSSYSAFAALRSDGSVVTWGSSYYGGDSTGVDFDGPNNNLSVTQVIPIATQIFSNTYAFAALRSDGSVVTWGSSYYGGDSTGVDFDGPNNNLSVTQVFPISNFNVFSANAFAALRSDGSVVTWGSSYYGGDSTGVDFDGPNNNLSVTQIVSNTYASAALRSDGSVVTWGEPHYGGDSTAVDFDGPSNNLSVTQVFSSIDAFAALRSDGSVVTWGYPHRGGNSTAVDFDGPNNNLSVTQIFSSEVAFAALRSDGSVVTWGLGGDSTAVDLDGPNNNLSVTQIFSNLLAFAALRSDGSVVTWGDPDSGGDSTGVDFDGPSNNLSVTQIFSNLLAFAALRSDGSVVKWGDPDSGGDSTGVDFDGPSNNLSVTQIFLTSVPLRRCAAMALWSHGVIPITAVTALVWTLMALTTISRSWPSPTPSPMIG